MKGVKVNTIVIDSNLNVTWYWITLSRVISVMYCLLQCYGPCCTYRIVRPVFLLHRHIQWEEFSLEHARKVFLNHSNGHKPENSQTYACTSRQIMYVIHLRKRYLRLLTDGDSFDLYSSCHLLRLRLTFRLVFLFLNMKLK